MSQYFTYTSTSCGCMCTYKGRYGLHNNVMSSLSCICRGFCSLHNNIVIYIPICHVHAQSIVKFCTCTCLHNNVMYTFRSLQSTEQWHEHAEVHVHVNIVYIAMPCTRTCTGHCNLHNLLVCHVHAQSIVELYMYRSL